MKTVDIARKQRHMFLLRKVQENKALSKTELNELERFERQTAGRVIAGVTSVKPSTKPSTKRGKKKTAKRKTKCKRKARPPISVTKVRRLGFEYESLVAADPAAGAKKLLSKILPKYPKLQAAWDRGQFLRNLQALAGVVATIEEASHKLNLPSAEALRDMIDTDAEVGSIWKQTRLNAIIEARRALLDSAREGNHVAIQAVENYLREEKRPIAPGGKADLARVRQVDLVGLLGVPKSTFQHWTNEQGMPRNRDGTYSLANVIQWHVRFIERKLKEGIKILPADKLRDLRTEEKRLNLDERKHQLLDRGETIAGFVGRWKDIVYAFEYKKRELAGLVHGQTIDNIEDILGRFFDDVRRSWIGEKPEFLHLPEEAGKKLDECLELCKLN
ncbi:hypothetical protein ES703_28933 [subsurface metagenome]